MRILLHGGAETIVDRADADLAQLRWYENKGYARRDVYRDGYIPTYLHRLILARKIGRELLPGEQCDHQDGDKLNNQRSNLRLASPAQNRFNCGKRGAGTSRFKGVHWRSDKQKWAAQIEVRGKSYHLCYTDDEREAAMYYNCAAAALFGPYARLNDLRKAG